jgi:haloalkane dehalogenase
LRHITLFCQDWGSLIGLRLAAGAPARFDRIVLANGGLPTGTGEVRAAFKVWRAFARFSPWFPIGRIVKAGCADGLSAEAVAAYDAPFPSSRYAIAARLGAVKRWDKPFLTLFSNRDPVTRGGHKIWEKRVPGAHGQPHAVTRGAGHFLQEDKGAEVARACVAFMRATPGGPGTRFA